MSRSPTWLSLLLTHKKKHWTSDGESRASEDTIEYTQYEYKKQAVIA